MATYTIKRPPGAPSRFRIDYRSELNAAQLEVATTLEGPVLVVAGAGSGKTRTLVYRVARLVESGVPSSSILLLTFTRKAAQEMLRRAETLLESTAAGFAVTGGTFHSFANTVLRRYAKMFGWPERFSILDRGDSEDSVNLVRTRLGLTSADRRFPRKRTLAAIFSTAVNKGWSIAQTVDREYPHLFADVEDIARCRDAYAEYKRGRQLLDYDDLLLELRDKLRDIPELAERLSRVLRYIMIDEYQDTNVVQADIVQLLGRAHENVLAVGDDAQSIYGFRGADVRNILQFPERFPGAKVIALEQNYRSSQPILDLTNAIIAVARQRHSKTLFTQRKGGEKPFLVPTPDEAMQSRFVGQRVLELQEEAVPLSEIAVLFRSSFLSFDLELELARLAIPFVKRGGFRFLETAHIKDVLAHLRVLANPLDSVSWLRILLLLDGVGPKAASQVIEWLTAGRRAARELGRCLDSVTLRGQAALGLRSLAALFEKLDAEQPGPKALVETTLDHYRPILERVHRDDAPKRLRDLEQFATIAERFRSLDQMLADLALEPPNDSSHTGGLEVDPEAGERLTLSTIHSAKGLEWHTVFVIWVADGQLPSSYSVDEDEIEEERRLLYVACTRAKDYLYLSYPLAISDRSLGYVVGHPSRFLDDVPRRLMEPVTLLEDEGEGDLDTGL